MEQKTNRSKLQQLKLISLNLRESASPLLLSVKCQAAASAA